MMHIIYTEEQGKNYRVISYGTDEETIAKFKEIIKDGRFEFRTGDRIVKVLPAYVCLVEDLDDYDFVLGRSRKDPPKEEKNEKS